ncbi:hypothetical protein GA0115233_107114 [Streptomyces sp. DI166]|nr:hypothetical protein GA0115233_107114 [Streptomyces sp. DI166]
MRARSPLAIWRKRPMRSAHWDRRLPASRSARCLRWSNGMRCSCPGPTPHVRISAASLRAADAARAAADWAAARIPGTRAVRERVAVRAACWAAASALRAASMARWTDSAAALGTVPSSSVSSAACSSASPTAAAVRSVSWSVLSACSAGSWACRVCSRIRRSVEAWESTAMAAAYGSPAVVRRSSVNSAESSSAVMMWWLSSREGAMAALARRCGRAWYAARKASVSRSAALAWRAVNSAARSRRAADCS